MSKAKITNDMEYWQLKEEYAKSLLLSRTEEDKKKKKAHTKEASKLDSVLTQYEKQKIKNVKKQVKEEKKREKIRLKTKCEENIFFEISKYEAKYIDYANLNKKQREKLAVKKESLVSSLKAGMYVKLKGDSGIYQIQQEEERMNGLSFVSTVIYGDVTIQDTALMISGYYYASEIEETKHKISD